jgi:hypothetical protein
MVSFPAMVFVSSQQKNTLRIFMVAEPVELLHPLTERLLCRPELQS